MIKPIAFITGASGGIGAEISIALGKRGFDLILHARAASQLDGVCARLAALKENPGVRRVAADLSRIEGVRALVSDVQNATPKLGLLINNAGVLLETLVSAPTGVDMHTQVNLIAPYALMTGLRTQLAAAKGQVLNVSSGAILRTGPLDPDGLVAPKRMVKLFGPYAQSKLALSAVTKALSNEFLTQGILIASADPGPNRTAMTAGAGMPWFLLPIRHLLFPGPAKGATELLKALDALEPKTAGEFFIGKKPRNLPATARDPKTVQLVMELCETTAKSSA